MTVTVSDDLDGGPADETVPFCLDGRSYEIDLSADNARRLRELLHRYLVRVSLRNPGAAADAGTASHTHADDPRSVSAVLRAWAVANGYPVSRVGRIPAHIAQAYTRRGGHESATDSTPASVTYQAGPAETYPIHHPQQEPTSPEAL